MQLTIFPAIGAICRRGDRKKNLVLNAIRVLEFIDQNRLVTPSDRLPYLFVLPHQFAEMEKQVIEVEDGSSPFAIVVTFKKQIERCRKHANKRACDMSG